MCVIASLGAASLVAFSTTAQTPAPTSSDTSAPAAISAAPVKLPYGVEDVLKLSRAQVSEDVILNFIHNSGTIYNLGPNEIVYLRNQGVSDTVINAMLAQRQIVPAQVAAQNAAPTAPNPVPAPVSPDASAAAAAQASAQYAPTYVQPAPVYAEAQPAYAPASTLYVIPYCGTGYGYGSCYPYYYGGPSIVFGFGYGGGRYCGPYYRGYYGGHYGGYYHGGPYRHYGHH
jgi:hypothetical protein